MPPLASLLHSLNSVSSRYFIEYARFLSNHFDHGLVALHSLGVDRGVIAEYMDKYEKHTVLGHTLESPGEQPAQEAAWVDMSGGKWQEYLGKKQHFSALVASFQATPATQLWREVYPVLLHGSAGRLLHAVIQLGFLCEDATARQDSYHLARSFAYYCYAAEPTPNLAVALAGEPGAEEVQRDGLLSYLVRLVEANQDIAQEALGPVEEGAQERIAKVVLAAERLQGLPDARLSPSLTLDQAMDFAFELFARFECHDFFVLHLLTATRACKTTYRTAQDHGCATSEQEAVQAWWSMLLVTTLALSEERKQRLLQDAGRTLAVVLNGVQPRRDLSLRAAAEAHVHADPEAEPHPVKVAMVAAHEEQEGSPNGLVYRKMALCCLERYLAKGWL